MREKLFLIFAVFMIAFVGKVFAQSQTNTYSRIYSFRPADGHSPAGPLVETPEKTFVGAIRAGAAGDRGGLYEVTRNGLYSLLHSFGEADGYRIANNGGLLFSAGQLFGTNDLGGQNGQGTIFRFSKSEKFKVIYTFNGEDGSGPNDLELGHDGYMYGTCRQGGVAVIPAIEGSRPGHGTIFKINPAGQLETLHVFHPYLGFGETSPQAGLFRAADGLFYGSSLSSVTSDLFGAAFTISKEGLYEPKGAFFNSGTPVDKFTQAGFDGQIYGVYPSGASGLSNLYGSLFKVPYSVLSSELQFFSQEAGGPRSVTAGNEGDLYISTSNRIYSYNLADGLKLIHDFGASVSVVHRLLIASDGNIYGTTSGGGEFGLGEVFKIQIRQQIITPTVISIPPPVRTTSIHKPVDSPPSIGKASCWISKKNRNHILNCISEVLDDVTIKSVTLRLKNSKAIAFKLRNGAYYLRVSKPFLNARKKRFTAQLTATDNAGQKTILTLVVRS